MIVSVGGPSGALFLCSGSDPIGRDASRVDALPVPPGGFISGVMEFLVVHRTKWHVFWSFLQLTPRAQSNDRFFLLCSRLM